MIIFIALATFVATLLGGLFALRLKDKLHLILGFSAGAVIAVTFFDLIPESLEMGEKYFSVPTILAITAAGFLLYLTVDRLFDHHGHEHDLDGGSGTAVPLAVDEAEIGRKPSSHEMIGAVSLCLHSFFDGMAVGLAFQVSSVLGIIVAFAVLTHKFSDGINIVSIILKHGGQYQKVIKWLFVDSVAPILGIVSTLFFAVSERSLSLIMAVFAGFFLYIGASELIPEGNHSHPKFLTTAMTLVGAGVIYLTIQLAPI